MTDATRDMRDRDHPRIRGEGLAMVPDLSDELGSPPHSRGRRGKHWRKARQAGITPAFAGKAISRSGGTASARDHPRIRGEGSNLIKSHYKAAGSPPHSRGRRYRGLTVRYQLGITPAFAGKAPGSPAIRIPVGDHPRIRGEGLRLPSYPRSSLGSPPHSRGRHQK